MSEPERPIEKLLQTSAQERRRRAGGPFEPHPATRRLLQGEVVRQYGVGGPAPMSWTRWFQLGPRFAWSLGTFLVFGVATWIAWQANQPTHLGADYAVDRSLTTNQISKEQGAVALAPTPGLPAPGAPRAAPAPSSASSSGGGLAADSIVATPRSRDARLESTAPAAIRSAESAAQKTKALEKQDSATRNFAARQNPIPPTVASTQPDSLSKQPASVGVAVNSKLEEISRKSASTSGAIRDKSLALPMPAEVSQSFPFSNQIAIPVTNALASFTVEQNGADLKVVDADGSVYTGQLLLAGAESRNPAASSQIVPNTAVGNTANYGLRGQANAPAQALNQNQLNFRVEGTNRSLNQNVVFTGNFVPRDSAANAQMISNLNSLQNNRALNQGQLRNRLQSQQQVPWNNGRISGQAVLGNTQTIPVEASPPQK